MTAKKNNKCKYQKKSEVNGHLYCKKSKAGAYCVEDHDSKSSVFKCPLDPSYMIDDTANKKISKTGPVKNE